MKLEKVIGSKKTNWNFKTVPFLNAIFPPYCSIFSRISTYMKANEIKMRNK